jgi:intein/homing endonuclease
LVHTENGLKPISEVKVGDKVLSIDERTETTLYQPVMAVIQGVKQYQMVKITLDSGESIEATAEHPFYIKGKGWNPANSLKVGQALQLHNGTTVVIKEIDTSVRLEKVYNLTVAHTHNYFVGEDGVLVHNGKGNKKKGSNCGPGANVTPKKYKQEKEKIRNGQGTPRLNDDGSQKQWEGRKHKRWKDGYEWEGPDRTRIIEKDGKWGWSDEHWDTIHDFID